MIDEKLSGTPVELTPSFQGSDTDYSKFFRIGKIVVCTVAFPIPAISAWANWTSHTGLPSPIYGNSFYACCMADNNRPVYLEILDGGNLRVSVSGTATTASFIRGNLVYVAKD